tara:strand:- start:111 stop:281 length:171 start_codon:yes stop_codon:yes gene_type:complete
VINGTIRGFQRFCMKLRKIKTPLICIITAKIKNIAKKITINKLANKKLSIISLSLV